MTDQGIKELEYNGKPIRDLIIEMSITMKQILERVVHIEENLVDLQNRKVDKNEVTSILSLVNNLEKRVNNLEKWKTYTVGVVAGFSLVFTFAWGIIFYLITNGKI